MSAIILDSIILKNQTTNHILVMVMNRRMFMEKVSEYVNTLDIDELDKRIIMRKVMSYSNTKSELSDRDLWFIKQVTIPSVIWRGL